MADVSGYSGAELRWAATLGDLDRVRQLVEENNHVDINATDGDGDTALHCAATYGRRAVVKYLLDCGASDSIKNAAGKTPLDCARRGDVRAMLSGGNDDSNARRATSPSNNSSLYSSSRSVMSHSQQEQRHIQNSLNNSYASTIHAQSYSEASRRAASASPKGSPSARRVNAASPRGSPSPYSPRTTTPKHYQVTHNTSMGSSSRPGSATRPGSASRVRSHSPRTPSRSNMSHSQYTEKPQPNTFGGTSERFPASVTSSPGPGAYSPKKEAVHGHLRTPPQQSQSRFPSSKTPVPGPGAYNKGSTLEHKSYNRFLH